MLNRRKIKILEAIIRDYIVSAEPIGSRTIAKKYDLGVSSATIRNEMSDLEDMGYILQPHASSGRVPSDKGYRLYVDEVMQKKNLPKEQREYLKAAIAVNLNQIDRIMQDVARAVYSITGYTTVAAEPAHAEHRIKHIQIVPVDEHALALMVVTDLKAIKNQVVFVPKAPGPGMAAKMSEELTKILQGACAADLNNLFTGRVRKCFADIRAGDYLAEPLMQAISAALSTVDDAQIHLYGIKNILDFPEFADLDKAKAIVGALEEKEGLLTLLDGNFDKIQVIIGTENENIVMKDCSVIKAKIRVNEHFSGNIAIIGPTRMDYSQAMSVINVVLKNISVVEL